MRIGFGSVDNTGISIEPLPVYWTFQTPFWVYLIPGAIAALVLITITLMCVAWKVMNRREKREEETQILLS
jgi:hypothetical protein